MIVNHKDFGVNVFANFAHNEGKLMKISESLKAYNERVDAYLTPTYAWYRPTAEQSLPFLKYEEGRGRMDGFSTTNYRKHGT